MSDLTESQKEDYQKYFIDRPDSGFSPERNKEIVERSITAYEGKRRLQSNEYIEHLKERVDAAVSFLYSTKNMVQGVEQYFGRKYLAYLQGQRILQKMTRLKNGQSIITLEEVA